MNAQAEWVRLKHAAILCMPGSRKIDRCATVSQRWVSVMKERARAGDS